MTDTQDRRTRADDVEVVLRDLVDRQRRLGELRLPPEKELSEQLGIARSTLREAMIRLEMDGEIERRRRIGTVIVSPKSQMGHGTSFAFPVNPILSLSEYLTRVGADYTVRSVAVHRGPATAEVAVTLGLPQDGQVFVATRLYEVEGKPAAHLEHTLPVRLRGNDVRIAELTEGATTFLQETEHVTLTRVESTITAEMASVDMAGILDVAEGSPLLVMHAQMFADDKAPVALGRLIFRPDVLSLAATSGDATTSTSEPVSQEGNGPK